MIVAVGGFVTGYVLGTRAGKEGFTELLDAWNVIRNSDEFRGAQAAATAFVTSLIRREEGAGREAPRFAGVERIVSVATEAAIGLLDRRTALRAVGGGGRQMHEHGLAEDIVVAACARANGRRVRRVRVQVGAMLAAEMAAMEQAFEHAAEGTELDGAVLDLVQTAAQAVCRTCGAVRPTTDRWAACAACGGLDVDVSGGEEMILESIEYVAQAGDVCLGIPGRVVELGVGAPELASVDVAGALRPINLGLLADTDVQVGDWVMIHMGFALEKMTEQEARDGLAVLETLGPGGDDGAAMLEEEPRWR